MAEAETYNLDDDSEFFKFTIFGNNYKFRYLTGDEMDKIKAIVKDKKDDLSDADNSVLEYLYSFIEPTDETSKPFSEVKGQMKNPHIKKFTNMLKTELGLNG